MEKVLRPWDQAVVAEYSYDAWGNLLDWSGPLAERNPIRYRGYYYDTETGFYYLQSRYYDPQTGRFINADGLITTGQGLMSYNMFAYCLDNMVNYYDKNGDDAIWIQEEESAYGAGHTGLIVQDEEGNWWYFYWGPNEQNMNFYTKTALILGATVQNGSYLVKIELCDGDITVNDVRMALTKARATDINHDSAISEDRINNISGIVRFEGNYVPTYYYEKCLANSGEGYNLFSNNCSEKTITALAISNPLFSVINSSIITKLIPIFAYKKIRGASR